MSILRFVVREDGIRVKEVLSTSVSKVGSPSMYGVTLFGMEAGVLVCCRNEESGRMVEVGLSPALRLPSFN
jgi:hypothetical protein